VKPVSDDHTELAQRLTTLTERVSRVSLTLAEAGRNLMERRALPPDTLVDEMAAVHADFADLRDRVAAAAATLAAGTPPPITTLRELEVLMNVLVEGDARRARRQPAEEGPSAAAEDAPPVAEARRKTDEQRGDLVVEETPPQAGEEARRKTRDEARRKAAEAEEAWRRAEAEAERRAGEEAQRRAAEDARRRAEDETRRKAAEAEDARRKAEDESRRNAVVAEEGRRKAAEAEARRKAQEEAERQAAEETRQKAAAAEAKRKAEEDARQKTVEAEAKRRAAEEAQERAAEEARRTAEEEARQKAADMEAKRKADQEAQREAQERAAEEARRRAEEEARQNAEKVEGEIAEPVAAAEDEMGDAGLETAQWWISASANWASMRSKKVSFAAAVSDVLTKYPYFLSVPIQTSADYEDGMVAYGYGILLEHIEQRVPSFVSDALARLPARPGVSLGRRLYDYLAQALGVGYGDFIKAVMLAAVPKALPWATGGIEDGDATTTVFVRPSARIGDTHQKAERFTQAYQRFGEHHFTAAVAPLTTRFFRVEALDVKEARHLGLRISEKGVPSDQAWVISMAGRGSAPQARRHVPQGTVINGLGREFTSVWVGLFNADAENEKRYDVTVEVTRRQPGTSGFRKR
jgi:hypothetical protein